MTFTVRQGETHADDVTVMSSVRMFNCTATVLITEAHLGHRQFWPDPLSVKETGRQTLM